MAFDGRDERVADLYFIEQPTKGDPAEDGLTRYTGSDLLFNLKGAVVSLISGTGITAAQHDALRQLIHFVDDGPGTGFTSGAYKETTPAGPFPTSEIWWTDSGKTKKIVSLDTTWTGAKITQEVWKVYAADGVTVLATLTDVISYSGFFETSRTRSWSV